MKSAIRYLGVSGRPQIVGGARGHVQPHIAERILSHAQPGVAWVYDRYQYLDDKRKALEQWAAHVKGLRRAATSAGAAQRHTRQTA